MGYGCMSALLSGLVEQVSSDRIESPRKVDLAKEADVLSAELLCDLLVLLKGICSSIAHEVDRRLACHDLTLAKAMPLLLLLESPDNTVTAIARFSHSDAGAMTRILYELEGKGMISRFRSHEDRRVVYLELRKRGLRVARSLPSLINSAADLQLAGFESGDRNALIVSLRRMTADQSPRVS